MCPLGDFRLSLHELRAMSQLHSNGSVIDIDTLYLDTTFCHSQAQSIISRVGTIIIIVCALITDVYYYRKKLINIL